MNWAEITFNGVTEIVILAQKMTFDKEFYIENALLIAKRYGNK